MNEETVAEALEQALAPLGLAEYVDALLGTLDAAGVFDE